MQRPSPVVVSPVTGACRPFDRYIVPPGGASLENVAINDAEAIALVEKAMAGALEHKEEYEKMMVNLAGRRQVDSIIKII
ncbi:hypothetical protein [Escherichia phage phiWec189]|uniref:Uncharacterized protein n=1 Tax=Escherichia phage phiWec189 TaxID=2992785 RepID=A0ACA8S9P2_9CAUD|nr:hypothetical protein [Escherichia phage phiWec189]